MGDDLSREKQLQKEVDLLREQLRLSKEENILLRQKVDLLVRKIFGSSAENVDIDQLLLFEEEEAKKPDAPDNGAVHL